MSLRGKSPCGDPVDLDVDIIPVRSHRGIAGMIILVAGGIERISQLVADDLDTVVFFRFCGTQTGDIQLFLFTRDPAVIDL